MEFETKHQFPTNKEFNTLFESVGWGCREEHKIEAHRKSSCFSVCVYHTDQIVGMARVVGDGAYFTIFDVVVHKNHQKRGIGSILMNEIIAWFESIKDDDSHLYLGASENKEKFYEKFGFKSRPYSGMGAGMKYDPN